MLAGVGMLSVSTDSLWIRLSEADAVDVSFWVACCSVPLYTALSHRVDGCWPLEAFRRHPWQQLVIGVLTGGSQLCFVIAVTQTRVANVVAIVAAVPLLAAVSAWIWLRERISRAMAIAIAITMGGIGAIVSSSVGEPSLKGDLLGVLAIVGFSVSLTMWRRYPDMSRLVGLSIGGVMTVVVLLAYWASPLSLDLRAPVADVALFSPIETVAGTIWAAAFFSVFPQPVAAVGAVIVLVGVFYGTIATTRPGVHRFAPVADVALFSPIETVAGTIWAKISVLQRVHLAPRPVAAVR